MMKHIGNCFCSAVEIEVSGSPEAMGYCHCRSCRSWSGGPVNAFSLWKPGAVRVTAGSEHMATFAKTPMSQRQYCRRCDGHLMTSHPRLGMIDVFAANNPDACFCARRSRQLRRNGAADSRRPAQAEGFSGRIRRLRGDHGGIAGARPPRRTMSGRRGESLRDNALARSAA